MDVMIQKDFGDWLSPMVVKEIRQGFRSRVFVFAFLLIQGLMIFCVVLSLLASGGGDISDSSSVFFWMIICIPLLLMPFLGFGVIGNEIKGNTMELVFLTRLSSWRIVVGKWTAIMAQTILIVCSVLPYMVLRYFIGGVNLLDDLQFLGWLLFASAILTGVTIASFSRTVLAKVLVPIVMLAVVIVVLLNIMGPFMGATGVGFSHGFLMAAVLGPPFLLLMFEIAVARIAPPAENHSVRKRLLGFLILGAIAALNRLTGGLDFLKFLCLVLLLPVCITGLFEDVKPIPSIYLPFVKRGFFGRLAGWLFYPGWPSGLLFTILVFAAYIAIFSGFKTPYDGEIILAFISMGGALLMPLAIEKLFFAKLKKTAVVYFSVQVFMIVASVLAATMKGGPLSAWSELVAPLPTSVLFLGIFGNIEKRDIPLFIYSGSIVLVASLVILLIKCIKPRREIASMEKIARGTLMKPAEPEITHANAA